MRLIDADALNYTKAFAPCGNGKYETVNIVYETDIDAMPTIDVPDRKFGEWMAEPNCWYRCSNCGQHYPSIRGYMDYKYCPNCGAKMERSEE